MKKTPIPENEDVRVKILKSLEILNKENEDRFDRITNELARKLRVPISTVTFLEGDKEIYKSSVGILEKSAPRDISFCGHALFSSDIFVVEDTLKDERFSDNPHVLAVPPIRFYAGVSLKHKLTSTPIGVLCIKDYRPRVLNAEEVNTLLEMAKETEYELNKVREHILSV